MKKIIIAVLAVAAMVACSTEQTVVAPKGDAIGFSTFVDNATRATDITKDNLVDFGVYASIENASGAGMILTNERAYKNAQGAWIYGNTQYWVPTAMYEFTAFAPHTGAHWTYTPDTPDDGKKTADNGDVTFNNDADADQDFIFAYAYRDLTSTAKLESQPDAVEFTFKHMLSKVAFSFINTFTDGNTTLSVYNVKINNTAKTGTMAIANGVDAAWEVDDADVVDKHLVVPFGDQATAVNTLKAKALANGAELKLDHHYVIPAQRAYNITFSVDLYQAGVYLATYNHAINSTINFAKNGNYVLSVKLAPETIDPDNELFPIEFTVNNIGDWDNGNTVDADDPADNVNDYYPLN